MLPINNPTLALNNEINLSDLTYRVSFRDSDTDSIVGYVDGLDAIKQSIYFILASERYAYPIYSWNYGIELQDLVGQPMPYVMCELERRIEDALLQDERITSVSEFNFEIIKNRLNCTFVVYTTQGTISTNLEVPV